MSTLLFLTLLLFQPFDGNDAQIEIGARSVRAITRKSDHPLIRVEIRNIGSRTVYVARKAGFNRRAGLAGFSCSSKGWQLEGADAWLVQPKEDDLDRFIRDSWIALDPDRSYVGIFDLGSVPTGIKAGPHKFECEYYDSVLDRLTDRNRQIIRSKLGGEIVVRKIFDFTVNISE